MNRNRMVQPKSSRYKPLTESNLWKDERERRESKNKSNIYEIFFVQVCKRRCKRNNFDDAIFLFAWSHASHVFQIVILRVSVEPVDVAVVSNVSFLSVFFLDKSFNKKNVSNCQQPSYVFRVYKWAPLECTVESVSVAGWKTVLCLWELFVYSFNKSQGCYTVGQLTDIKQKHFRFKQTLLYFTTVALRAQPTATFTSISLIAHALKISTQLEHNISVSGRH